MWENLFLCKTSLIKEKSYLEENFLDRGKIFASEIIPYSRKNHCLWKTSLIKGTSLPLENFPDKGNVFAYGKTFPCGKLIDQRKYMACLKFP